MLTKVTMRSLYDDLDISVLVVTPEQEPKAVLQIAHGICGCKERFIPFMEYMAAHGVVCVTGDHRGHGASIKSTDDLGYMYDGGYYALVEDMRMITDWIHNEYPGKPVYLLGHSMGSMAARVYVKYDDSAIDGLIICGSPSWNPYSRIGYGLMTILCWLGMSHRRFGFIQQMTSDKYNKKFAEEGYQAWTCSDKVQRKSVMENPLCNFTRTANGTRNLLGLMIDTYRKGEWAVNNPEMPVHFISGDEDPMMLDEKRFHKSAQNLCDRGYLNVTSALYQGMRHEVLNEIGKEDVWNEILDFMNLK
jgi:alpha-beta hydrolase superfamily lysophospholipase